MPRARFVPAAFGECAYEHRPLPIEAGQTISQPYIVACMVAAVEPGDGVLKIGTGSGNAVAVMSRIARQVTAIERYPELTWLAGRRMAGE